MTKTQEALELFKQKEYKQAFKIFKTFRINFSKEESKQISRTFEMFNNIQFYNQLGYNFNEELNKSIDIIENKYKVV